MLERQSTPEATRIIGLTNFASPEFPVPDTRTQLRYAEPHLRETLERFPDVVFVAYAANNMDRNVEVRGAVLKEFGAKTITALHKYRGNDLERVLHDAGSVYVDGGNTPRLIANLKALRHEDDGTPVDPREDANADIPLVEPIQQGVAQGKPYIGLSAGTMVLCADTRIANDPHGVVQRKANGDRVVHVDALRILPENLNIIPHYIPSLDEAMSHLSPETIAALPPEIMQQLGEMYSMPDNIAHAISLDPKKVFLGMPDLTYLVVNGQEIALEGESQGPLARQAVIFQAAKEPQKVSPRVDLTQFLS